MGGGAPASSVTARWSRRMSSLKRLPRLVKLLVVISSLVLAFFCFRSWIYRPVRRAIRRRNYVPPPPPELAHPEDCWTAQDMQQFCTEEDVTVWLSTNARDEKNIVEWVAYHLVMGFDRIMVVDDQSATPIKESLAGVGLLADGLVEVVTTAESRYNLEPTSKKTTLMHNIVRPWALDGGATWMIHIDSDEYVNLRGNWPGGVRQLMSCYPGASVVPARWQLFGNGGHRKHPWGQFVIEAYTRAQNMSRIDWWQEHLEMIRFDPGPGFDYGFLTKTFVRPEHAASPSTPHSWYLIPGSPPGVTPTTRKEYLPTPWLPYGVTCGADELVTINHYAVQDVKTFMSRKINRPRDDDGNMREELRTFAESEEGALVEWMGQLYNEVDDYDAADVAPQVHLLVRCAHHAKRQRHGVFPDSSNIARLTIQNRAAECEALLEALPPLTAVLGRPASQVAARAVQPQTAAERRRDWANHHAGQLIEPEKEEDDEAAAGEEEAAAGEEGG